MLIYWFEAIFLPYMFQGAEPASFLAAVEKSKAGIFSQRSRTAFILTLARTLNMAHLRKR